MDGYQTNGHVVYDIKYHMVWVTNYRYGVLKGRIGRRTRELIRQGCQARRITILQGTVGKDHVHILVSCPTSLAPSTIIQYLKGRTSRLLQEEFPELQKSYWKQNLWARGYFCATAGTVTEEIIRNYIANQKSDEKDQVFKAGE